MSEKKIMMLKFDLWCISTEFFFLHIISFDSNALDLKERMINHKIIPDLISEAPLNDLKIFYPVDNVVQELKTGQSILHTQGEHEPRLEWPTRANKSYTLFMSVRSPIYQVERERKFNPSLGNQTHVQWQNWIVVNIPESQVTQGAELAPYKPLQLPLPHTQDLATIFIWEQPEYYESVNYDHCMGAKKRYGNTQLVRTFMNQFQFGTPWAGDFFYVKCTT